MKTSDITLVFQGAFKPYITREHDRFLRNIRLSRQALPGARAILSTWEGSDLPARLPVDAVVLSKDPGGLPPLKLDDGKANNINRQLITTRAGLAAVGTRYAVKMRTDCYLEHAGFLDFHAEQLQRDAGRERVLACSFFTLDPTVFERIPYHVSDWFQFGTTDLLRSWWSAGLMGLDDARYYEAHPHQERSSFFEKKFRARFAVEQYICMQYAGPLGYACPRFLNDLSETVMRDYYRFLRREIMLLDPWQIGLVFPKYRWVDTSLFQSMNNLMNIDWIALQHGPLAGWEHADQLQRLIAQRSRQKQAIRWGFRCSRLLHAFLFDPRRGGHLLRKAAHRIARRL